MNNVNMNWKKEFLSTVIKIEPESASQIELKLSAQIHEYSWRFWSIPCKRKLNKCQVSFKHGTLDPKTTKYMEVRQW